MDPVNLFTSEWIARFEELVRLLWEALKYCEICNIYHILCEAFKHWKYVITSKFTGGFCSLISNETIVIFTHFMMSCQIW